MKEGLLETISKDELHSRYKKLALKFHSGERTTVATRSNVIRQWLTGNPAFCVRQIRLGMMVPPSSRTSAKPRSDLRIMLCMKGHSHNTDACGLLL